EVEIDVLLGLAPTDTQLARQAEGGHAVDEAEVDGLGAATLLCTDLLELGSKYLRRRRLVDVQPLRKGAQQAFVLGQVRHDAQLDLGIVRRQHAVARGSDEGLANAAAFFCTNGNV